MSDNMLVHNHWLNVAQKCLSPNANTRPENEISLIVIHNISLPPAQYGGNYVNDFFCNKLDKQVHPYFAEIADLKVSSHLFIRRDGEVVQFVPFDQRAWHAGVSSYGGRDNCNDYSIGIEMEGCDNDAYSELQYEALVQAVQALMKAYPLIRADRITGHEFIAPKRKTDPGRGFNWKKLFFKLKKPT